MKNLMVVVLFVLAASAGAVTVHRSFRNGYPAGAQGVKVRRQPNSADLKAPKMPQGGTKVVTNRVVLTKEQAEKLLKSRKGQKVKKVKVDDAGNTAN